jgi:hypothetical protein
MGEDFCLTHHPRFWLKILTLINFFGDPMKTITKKQTIILGFSLIVTLASALSVLVWLPSPAAAAPSLPPRYPPANIDEDGKDDDDRKAVGAYVELHVHSAQAGVWTVVQWQDNNGDWHDVEGWQGNFDQGNKKVWWVAAADFNKGPFRWATYRSRGGELLATSKPFYLPQMPNETMLVEVWLNQ